jgi:hypothetical protein
LLTDYARLIATAYRSDGVPPAMAALFSVAYAADEMPIPAQAVVRGWQALPTPVEQAALALIGSSGTTAAPLGSSLVNDLCAPDRTRLPGSPKGMLPRFGWR